MKFLNDILKTNDPEKSDLDRYSLSRSLLLLCALLYLIANTFGYFTLFTTNMNIDIDALSTITESLRWLVILFAGYAFGSKFLSANKQKELVK